MHPFNKYPKNLDAAKALLKYLDRKLGASNLSAADQDKLRKRLWDIDVIHAELERKAMKKKK